MSTERVDSSLLNMFSVL